jgi:hypothetical protein
MVHARKPDYSRPDESDPDAVIRLSPDDPGTITEFKTPVAATHNSARANINSAGQQVGDHGGGIAVLDLRPSGMLEADARRGYARAVGYALAHHKTMPERVLFIMPDGHYLELPDR